MSKPKYQRGPAVISVYQALALIESRAVFYIRGATCSNKKKAPLPGWKTVPSAFLEHWSVAQIKGITTHGGLFMAVPIQSQEASCQKQQQQNPS